MRAAALLLLCLACARAVPASKERLAACPKGALLYRAPMAPSSVVPVGADEVVVVDYGGLSLRDARTLELVRHLAPRLNGWTWAAAADGGLEARTSDGQRYLIALPDGAPRRLPDARVTRLQFDEVEANLGFSAARDRQEAASKAEAVANARRIPIDELPDLNVSAAWSNEEELVVADADGGTYRVVGRKTVARGDTRDVVAIAPLLDGGFVFATSDGAVIAVNDALAPMTHVALGEQVARLQPLNRAMVLLTLEGAVISLDPSTFEPLARLDPVPWVRAADLDGAGRISIVRVDGGAAQIDWRAGTAHLLDAAVPALPRTDGGFDAIDGYADVHLGPSRRAELRKGTVARRMGDYVLLASGAENGGALELFCAGAGDPLPSAVPPGDVEVIDGVREVAVDVEGQWRALTASAAGEAYVAVADAGVWRLSADAGSAQVLASDVEVLASNGPNVFGFSPGFCVRLSPFVKECSGPKGRVVQAVVTGQAEAFALGESGEIFDGEGRGFVPAFPVSSIVALSDGVLLIGSHRAARLSHAGVTEDALTRAVAASGARRVFARNGRVILVGRSWQELDETTGALRSDVPLLLMTKKRCHVGGPRPSPMPYLDTVENEIIRFVDRAGRPLIIATLRGPAWMPGYDPVNDVVDTDTGVWARQGTVGVLLWDGQRLSAFFPRGARERLLDLSLGGPR